MESSLVQKPVEAPQKPSTLMGKVGHTLSKVGKAYWNCVGTKSALRENFHCSVLFGFWGAFEQGIINGKLPLGEMYESRNIGNLANLLGQSSMMTQVSRGIKKLFRVTPQSSALKRNGCNALTAILLNGTWFMGQYTYQDVENFWRAVVVSTVCSIPGAMIMLPANEVANDYLTNDPKHRKHISKGMRDLFGCETLTADQKKLRYAALMPLTMATMYVCWHAGPVIHRAVVGGL